MYHYNSRNLKYTIATLRFAEPYHCLRMLAAWAHSQTYEYHTYFSMEISAPDTILIDPLRSSQWTDPSLFSSSRFFSFTVRTARPTAGRRLAPSSCAAAKRTPVAALAPSSYAAESSSCRAPRSRGRAKVLAPPEGTSGGHG